MERVRSELKKRYKVVDLPFLAPLVQADDGGYFNLQDIGDDFDVLYKPLGCNPYITFNNVQQERFIENDVQRKRAYVPHYPFPEKLRGVVDPSLFEEMQQKAFDTYHHRLGFEVVPVFFDIGALGGSLRCSTKVL